MLRGLDEDVPAKAASTAKIMCAYVVLQLADKEPEIINEDVTFSKLAASTPSSSAGIREGESIPVAELLYGLLLPSGNDAGNALAEHFNPTGLESDVEDDSMAMRANFVAQMNQQAQLLGIKNTVYRSPYGDGGTSDDRTTTPRDLLRLAWHAMQHERFQQIVGTHRYSAKIHTLGGGTRDVAWENTNRLLRIEDLDGVKTGTTSHAGSCLVSSGRRGDDHLLVVVLGAASNPARFIDSRNLFRWAWIQRGHRQVDEGP